MTTNAAALELIENPHMTTAADIDRELAGALPDDQLSSLEISHEIKALNIHTLAEMVLELDESKEVRLQTVEAGEQWGALVEFARGVRGVAA